MQNEPQFEDEIRTITRAFGPNPTAVIQKIEYELPGMGHDLATLSAYLKAASLTESTLLAALEVKRISGQINVLVHAAGILVALPAHPRAGRTNHFNKPRCREYR